MHGRDLFLPVIFALAPVAAVHAQFSDDFNDDALSGQWVRVADPNAIIEVAEANQRLEFTFAPNDAANTFAGIASNDWWFNPAFPVRFRIDFNFTPSNIMDGGDVGFVTGFSTSSAIYDGIVDDGVEFHYGVDEDGPYTGLREYRDGVLIRSQSFTPSATDQATAYITWDGEGSLCASFMGYGPQPDSICFFRLLEPDQVGDQMITPLVALFLGAFAFEPSSVISPDNAWLDNFVIDEGTTRAIASPNPNPNENEDVEEEDSDEPSEPRVPDSGENDADGNGRIDLGDLAVALRNGDSGPRVAEILKKSGFDPTRFSSQKWSKLMNGLYKHRIAPRLFPRPRDSEQSAAISALVQVHTGATGGTPVPDSGTPDANDDGIINFGDIARMLEAGAASRERLLETMLLIGLDPDVFPKKKYWKLAVSSLYESQIVSEFAERSKKDRKRDQKALLKLY